MKGFLEYFCKGTMRKFTKLSLLQVIGLFVISTGIATFSATIQTTEVRSKADISEHWRGKYDILVRSEASVSKVEAEFHLVEGNYLASSSGGITDQQYNVIKNIPGVEVAAPVATVGYLLNETGAVATSIQPFETDTLYRISWQWTGNDLPIQNREPQFAYFATSDNKLSSIFTAGSNSFTDVIGNSAANSVVLSLGRFPPLWVLVAGIDPEQEAKLIDLASTLQQGSYLNNSPLLQGVDISRGLKATKIPIIINDKSYINLGLRLDIIATPLIGNGSFTALQGIQGQQKSNGSLTGLDSLLKNGKSVLSQTIDLSDQLLPLDMQTIMFSTTNPPSLSNSKEGARFSGSMALDTNVLLKPGHYDYSLIDDAAFFDADPLFWLKSYGNWGDNVQRKIDALRTGQYSTNFLESLPAIDNDQFIYRPLDVISTSSPIILDVKGVYDISEIQRMIDPLSYAPLGIYEPPEAILKYDPEGKAVNPQILLPGLNPGNFVSRPPLALTNLAAARLISEKSDYIDAIRVKISGIDQYSAENQEKVESIAGEIRERTGLHVDIIAGSSPRKVWINVPELGYVQENWTTLGAATQIFQGINIANGTLLLILVLSSVLFIINSTNLSMLSRNKEIGILLTVGWRNTDLLKYLISDLCFAGLVGAFLSAIFSLLLSLALGLRPSPIVILMTSIIAPIMYISVGVPVILHTLRRNPSKLLAYGEYENNTSLWIRRKNTFGFLHFTIIQFFRKKKRALFSLFTFAISILMVVLVANILVRLQGSLQVTLLGASVAFTLKNYHYLMIITVLVIGIIVIYENLMLGVVERLREFQILHTLGWKNKHIFLLVYLESLVLAGFAGFIGSLAGSMIFQAFTTKSSPPDWKIFIGSIFLALLIGLIIAIHPTQYIAQNLSPSHQQPFQKQQKKSAVFLLSAVILGLIALVVFIGGRNDVVSSWLTISSKQVETNPIVEKIDVNSMLYQIQRITKAGPRVNNNDAEQKAVQDIISTLNEYGLKTYTERVPLQSLTLLDSTGTNLLTIPSQGFRIRETASRFKAMQSTDFEKPLPVIFNFQDSSILVNEPLSGRILILDDSYESIEQAVTQNKDLFSADLIVNIEADVAGEDYLSSQTGLLGKVAVGEVITAILPGQEKSDKEIWIMTHYDSSSNSPGANQSASGVATLCELARMLAKIKPTYTIRFIALPGLTNGFSGLIAYLQNHEEEISRVAAVFDISQTGNWGNISMGEFLSDHEGKDIQQEGISREDLARMKKDGQYFVRENWQRVIALDRSDLLGWFELQRNRQMGFGESPSSLRNVIIQAGNTLNIQVDSTVMGCPASISILLSDNLPAIAICGQQNDLTGTKYDDFSTINNESLTRATALIYQSVLDFMGVSK